MIIDATGLACPEPVILTKKAIASRPEELIVIVDNFAAIENVTRFAEHSKYSVKKEKDAEKCKLVLNKL